MPHKASGWSGRYPSVLPTGFHSLGGSGGLTIPCKNRKAHNSFNILNFKTALNRMDEWRY